MDNIAALKTFDHIYLGKYNSRLSYASIAKKHFYAVSGCEAFEEVQFGYLIGQTRNALFAALDKDMLPLELTASQFVVVIGAMRNRARTVNEFCQLAGIEPGPMSRILDRLEAKGIVRRVRDAKDRRQVNVTPTEKGIALYPRIHAGLHKVYGHLLNGFSEQESLALEHALEKILRNARGHVTTPLPGK